MQNNNRRHREKDRKRDPARDEKRNEEERKEEREREKQREVGKQQHKCVRALNDCTLTYLSIAIGRTALRTENRIQTASAFQTSYNARVSLHAAKRA